MNRVKNMKAVVFEKYGGPEVLELKDIPKPHPEKGEVLIKLKAASINDWDWQALRGIPLSNRTHFGLFNPSKIKVLGCDITGVVESVGPGVSGFRKGDEVFGDISGGKWGGFGEYITAAEKYLAVKPESISFEQAAAIPQSGVIALQSLRVPGRVKKGEHILINGAGGGSGSFTIMMAKSMGAEVTGVDNKHKQEFMLSMGADHVLDYMKADYTAQRIEYDRIIDHVLNRPLSHLRRAMKPGGSGLIVGGRTGPILKTFAFGKIGKKKLSVLLLKPNTKDLDAIVRMVEEGVVTPSIDKVYPLERTGEGMKYFGEGRHRGKVVIRI